MRKLLSRLFFISTAVLVSISAAPAADLAPPRGKVILTVSGAIELTNVGAEAVFDREMLEAQGLETIVTKTPWFDGATEFSGIRLDELMDLIGAHGQAVTAVALNNYVTTIPLEDFRKYRVILALKRDGQYMSVREKGPLFVIYPFDIEPDLYNEVYFGRSVWQVTSITVH